MSSVAVVSDVVEAFRLQGFEFVGKTDDGWFKLRGPLIPCGADDGIPCEVQLDPTFFDLPRIRLLEIPPELPNAVPHLGAEGGLCYLAKGTVVLDIYDPVGQSLACLQRAAAVLGQILKGEMIEDLAEECLLERLALFCGHARRRSGATKLYRCASQWESTLVHHRQRRSNNKKVAFTRLPGH